MTRNKGAPNQVVTETQAQIQDMFGQSLAVLSQPSPVTFERFERRGGLNQALIFVLVAALVSGVISALFAPLHGLSMIGQFITPLISIPVSFLVFTAAVYFIGNNLFKGTGTYNEVAYSFALFYVPLSILGTLIGIIPVLGWLASFLIGLVMIYFGYLAVQSSLNIRDTISAVVTLVLAGIANLVVGGVIAAIFGTMFAVTRAVTGN